MVELSVENLVDMMAEQTVALTVVTKADLMVVEKVWKMAVKLADEKVVKRF